MARTVVIVGAGATIAESIRLQSNPRPPLDRGFFKLLKDTRPDEFGPIANYMRRRYAVDILESSEDGLEAVMSVVYTDVRNESLANQAGVAFRAILRAINAQLASTTNQMPASLDCTLAKIILRLTNVESTLDDVALVTFNYDLQIEKALQALENAGHVTTSGALLNFPYCYGLPDLEITEPSSGELFPVGSRDRRGIRLYKLHGSLNWYSTHGSRSPSVSALLRTSRRIRITRRREPTISMTLQGAKLTYAFPVIVPPVLNKSAILPTSIGHLWTDSEKELSEAVNVIIVGYSCPGTDYEASNLLARSLRSNSSLESLTVIDINPNVVVRYYDLCRTNRIRFYSSADAYLM